MANLNLHDAFSQSYHYDGYPHGTNSATYARPVGWMPHTLTIPWGHDEV